MSSRPIKSGGVYRAAGRVLNEERAIYKNWGGRLPIALVYPNTYYLGMSNLGIHAIYQLLNSFNDIVCERVFLEKNDVLPISLESGRPLTDFAVIAFSISYEMDYFNAAAMLRNAGIPLLTRDRDETHPLVIGGGPCITANPMPVAPMFDCFGIGEAEALFPLLLPVLAEEISGDRNTLLEALSKIPGLYVPSIPPAKPVVRQWVKDFDTRPAASVVLTRETELGELYLIEAERGCQRGCRFCLVNGAFSPMRFHSASSILEQAGEGLHYRGRVGLVGPAVTDHPEILDIIDGVIDLGGEISVSSLRISSLSDDIIAALAKAGTRTLTIAPEAGSQRLRDVIDKKITEDDIFRTVESIARHDFTNLKLYFIIGLPTETDADIEDMMQLVKAMKERLGGRTRLTVNAGPFVPKAGTPFQWLPMAPQEDLARRLKMLKDGLSVKGVKVNDESPAWSLVQGVLSRGDERLTPAITGTHKLTMASWRKAVEEHHLDIDHYVNQKWDTTAPLPWSAVEGGTRTERLCAGLEKAVGENHA